MQALVLGPPSPGFQAPKGLQQTQAQQQLEGSTQAPLQAACANGVGASSSSSYGLSNGVAAALGGRTGGGSRVAVGRGVGAGVRGSLSLSTGSVGLALNPAGVPASLELGGSEEESRELESPPPAPRPAVPKPTPFRDGVRRPGSDGGGDGGGGGDAMGNGVGAATVQQQRQQGQLWQSMDAWELRQGSQLQPQPPQPQPQQQQQQQQYSQHTAFYSGFPHPPFPWTPGGSLPNTASGYPLPDAAAHMQPNSGPTTPVISHPPSSAPAACSALPSTPPAYGLGLHNLRSSFNFGGGGGTRTPFSSGLVRP
eukprot:524825-Pelagomonas_calceolata.AAC.1